MTQRSVRRAKQAGDRSHTSHLSSSSSLLSTSHTSSSPRAANMLTSSWDASALYQNSHTSNGRAKAEGRRSMQIFEFSAASWPAAISGDNWGRRCLTQGWSHGAYFFLNLS